MEQLTTRTGISGSATASGATASGNNPRVDEAALATHRTVDKVADKATAQVDRLSGSAHRAINGAADAASSAADWASAIPEQARQVQATVSESVCNSIRARPIATVAGALAVGYLLGRLARL